jgi:hypothetical protein
VTSHYGEVKTFGQQWSQIGVNGLFTMMCQQLKWPIMRKMAKSCGKYRTMMMIMIISSSTLCAAPIFRQTHIDMITQNLQDSEVYSTNGIGMASGGEAQAHHPLNPL